jgi:hypothetical protein
MNTNWREERDEKKNMWQMRTARISTSMHDFFSNNVIYELQKENIYQTLYALQTLFPHVCYPTARNLKL